VTLTAHDIREPLLELKNLQQKQNTAFYWWIYEPSSLNPLMPELNPSEQCCPPQFFTGDFKFECLLLEKKTYLINFSFKFNEIKFRTVLMNWLIREKCSPIFIIDLGLWIACII
jgi:hypothetical protein